MIAAAGIEDQELAITAKRPGVNNPTIARGSNLGARTGCDGQSLLSSTGAVRGAELANPRSIDRQTQMPAIRRERNGGRGPARLLPSGQIGARGGFPDGAGCGAGLAGGALSRPPGSFAEVLVGCCSLAPATAASSCG